MDMDPKILVPYMNSKDCSQGFCSINCPQWCYIIYPPPPPPPFEFSDDNSNPNLSPLVIAIIGILTSSFLLVSYYAIISNYCGDGDSSSNEPSQDLEENNQSPSSSLQQPWQPATAGVDDATVKSITLCKYRKGDGLIEGTDCSICLSEFEEDENLRLMPKCSHAFHVQCIDTWLKSHSNCPLCRANIIFFGASPSRNEINTADAGEDNDDRPVHVMEDTSVVRVHHDVGPLPKTPVVGFSNLGRMQARNHIIIEIRSEEECEKITRSISIDHSGQFNQDEDIAVIEEFSDTIPGSSNKPSREARKSSRRKRALHCVASPVSMKRSFSGGTFVRC